MSIIQRWLPSHVATKRTLRARLHTLMAGNVSHSSSAHSMPSVAASTQQQYVLVRNGEAQPCSVNSKTWLQTAPRGAYTTARTVQSTRVFKFTSHVERLATSANLMAANDAEVTWCALPPNTHLRTTVDNMQLV